MDMALPVYIFLTQSPSHSDWRLSDLVLFQWRDPYLSDGDLEPHWEDGGSDGSVASEAWVDEVDPEEEYGWNDGVEYDEYDDDTDGD